MNKLKNPEYKPLLPESLRDFRMVLGFRERLNIDKKNYSIVSRIIKEAIEAGVIVEYENSRMYVPYWAN